MKVRALIIRSGTLAAVGLFLSMLPPAVVARAPVDRCFTGGNATITLSFNDYVCAPGAALVARVKWDATSMDSGTQATVSVTGDGVGTAPMKLQKGVWGEFNVTPSLTGLQPYTAIALGPDGAISVIAKINVGSMISTTPAYGGLIALDLGQATPSNLVATCSFADPIAGFQFDPGILGCSSITDDGTVTYTCGPIGVNEPYATATNPKFSIPYSCGDGGSYYETVYDGEGIVAVYGDDPVPTFDE